MISIKYDGVVIYDPLAANHTDRLILTKATLKEEVNSAGTLTLEAPAENALFSSIVPMSGVVEVLDGATIIFRGRCISSTVNFYKTRQIVCEGLLACLNDSIVPPYDFPADYETDPDYIEAATGGNVVEFWLGKLIEAHNAGTASDQHITLGTVSVEDPNNYIARSCEDYSTTWKVLSEKFQKSSLGGYLVPRYASGTTYLDYVADFELTNTQTVRFAENLLDLKRDADATGVYTDLIPIGKDDLTIEELEDGAVTSDIYKDGNRIYSVSGRAAYGIITKVVEFEDVTLATNLLTKAAANLGIDGIQMPTSITLSAADLSGIDASVSAFRIARYVRAESIPHGISDLYGLTAINRDLLNPIPAQIQLGKVSYGIVQQNQAEAIRVSAEIDNQQRSIAENTDALNSLSQTTLEQLTAITQTTQDIVLAALEDYVRTSDMETYQRTIQSQLAVMADQVAINILSVTNQIEAVDGDMQSRFGVINEYFRFTTDGLFVGKEGNALELRVDNDRVSFLDNGYEVAYFSDRKLYVTDAEFLNFLQIGHFRWIPRRNGNMSLIKVG